MLLYPYPYLTIVPVPIFDPPFACHVHVCREQVRIPNPLQACPFACHDKLRCDVIEHFPSAGLHDARNLALIYKSYPVLMDPSFPRLHIQLRSRTQTQTQTHRLQLVDLETKVAAPPSSRVAVKNNRRTSTNTNTNTASTAMPATSSRSSSISSASTTSSKYADMKKKFSCNFPACGKSFSRSEHLHRHALNHKEGTNTCLRCSAHFRRRDLLGTSQKMTPPFSPEK